MISSLSTLLPFFFRKRRQVFLFILLFPFTFQFLYFQTLFFLISEETKRSSFILTQRKIFTSLFMLVEWPPFLLSWGRAQTVKNLPAMQETWIQSLGQEDPLEKMATHSSILPWKIPWTEEPGSYSPWVTKSLTQLSYWHTKAGDSVIYWNWGFTKLPFPESFLCLPTPSSLPRHKMQWDIFTKAQKGTSTQELEVGVVQGELV